MLKKLKMHKYLVFFFLLPIILEVGLFNFRSIESRFFPPLFNQPIITMSEGLYDNGDGTYTVLPEKEHSITLSNLNQEIKNVYLGLSSIEPDYVESISVELLVSDSGWKDFYYAGNRTIVKAMPESSTIRLHTADKVDSIQFVIQAEDYAVLSFEPIQLNTPVALNISWLRLAVCYSLFFVLLCFSPKSKLVQWKIGSRPRLEKGLLIVLATVISSSFILLSSVDPVYQTEEFYPHFQQYQKLADSLTQGKVNLLETPSKELQRLDNPYDYSARQEVDFLWDHAYFQGNYYVYFGVVPVLLFYLPYTLVTGQVFHNIWAIQIAMVIFVFSLLFLLFEFAKRYVKNSSYPFVCFMSCSALFLSGILYLLHKPDFYAVPIMLSLALTTLGLYLWLLSKNTESTQLKRLPLIAGSCCMALVTGCRPQFVVYSFLAIPLFWNQIKDCWKNKNFFIDLFVALLPYLLIGLGLMLYNHLRFNSPFDFGANYNLTTNDMTQRGFELDRLPIGIFSYLFQLPVITPNFPILKETVFTSTYVGMTIQEPTYGGLMMTNVLAACSLLIYPLRKQIQNKKIVMTASLLFGLGLLLVVMDIQMAGILQRYFSDFSLLFTLSGLLVIGSLGTIHQHPKKQFILVILCIISILLAFCIFLVHDQASLITHQPRLYFELENLFQFWK